MFDWNEREKGAAKDKSKRACIRGNNTNTYFNVIAVVNACQVGIDRVLIEEGPESRPSAEKGNKSIYIYKKNQSK